MTVSFTNYRLSAVTKLLLKKAYKVTDTKLRNLKRRISHQTTVERKSAIFHFALLHFLSIGEGLFSHNVSTLRTFLTLQL